MSPKRNHRFKIAGAAALAGTMLFSVPTLAHQHGFADVDESNVHYSDIMSMKEQGIFTGVSDTEFGSGQAIQRRHVAATIHRMLDLPVPDQFERFLEQYDDVDADSPMAAEIAAVTAAGIFKGDANNAFHPTAEISRQQVASVLVRSFGLSQVYVENELEINLDNVHPSHEGDVQTLRNLELTAQSDDYMPAANLTRDQFASFLHRSNEFDREEFQGEGYFNLSVLHTNDLHSRVNMYPQMITTLNEARTTRPDAITLDAGDIFSGTLYFNLFAGQDSLQFMNMMDYDAFVFGNHEFDLGDGEREFAHEELADFVTDAEFPIVGANMDFSAHAEFDPFTGNKEGITYEAENGMIYDGIVKEVNGEEVGIFGLNTEDTLDIASPVDVEFFDFAETAEYMVSEFQEAGIDKIIALTHLGYQSDPSVGNDMRLAQEIEGIDIIVGGHSHDAIYEPDVVTEDADGNPIEPTVIVQANEYGNYIGTLDVVFNAEGTIVQTNGELLATSDRVADATAADLLVPFTEEVEEFGKEPAGFTLDEQLPNPRGEGDSVRANETALGNLIADGFLRAGQRANPDTVIAFQNGGGVRAPLPETVEGDGPFEITIGDLVTVQPFGNRLSLLELSGEEIMQALEHSVRNAPGEDGGFLHVSGMRFEFDSSLEAGSRVTMAEVNMDGDYVALDMNAEYVVAMNNFTAAGGDGFSVFGAASEDGRATIVGDTDYQILMTHAQRLAEEEGEVNPQIEGRIVDTASEE